MDDRRPPNPPRMFTLADLMILIAGFAVGFAWLRVVERQALEEALMSSLATMTPIRLLTIASWLYYPLPIVATTGMALLICQLRRPRPLLRRLSGRPGAVAVAGSVLYPVSELVARLVGLTIQVVLVCFQEQQRSELVSSWQMYSYHWSLRFSARLHEVGPIVAACWLLLILSGRWRAEPDWLDRAGRVLGVYWIMIHAVRMLRESWT